MIRNWIFATLIAFGLTMGAHAQQAADPDDAVKDQLVEAYKILTNEGVLDGFGHVSARSKKDPGIFYMPRAMPPSLVTRDDILAIRVSDSQPIDPQGRKVNGERYIHGEIYKARPDVMAVIHSHSQSVIPLSLTHIPLKPVVAQAGFLPLITPTFEIRDARGKEERGMQVTDEKRGAALATALGSAPAILMRGHGDTVVGHSVKQAVVFAVYVDVDARMQTQAMLLSHDIVTMNAAELFGEKEFDINRPYEYMLSKTMTAAQKADIDHSQFGLEQTQKKQ
jgi:ribulose-5-phosphate 4-epimerase/fuculose-1-phosphate aldolase